MVEWIADNWETQNNRWQRARLRDQLSYFSTDMLEKAVEITRGAGDRAHRPIAYLQGVLKNLQRDKGADGRILARERNQLGVRCYQMLSAGASLSDVRHTLMAEGRPVELIHQVTEALRC